MNNPEQMNMRPEEADIDSFDEAAEQKEAVSESGHRYEKNLSTEKMQKKIRKFLDAHEKAIVNGFNRNGWTKKAMAPLNRFIQPFKKGEERVDTYLTDPAVAPEMMEALRTAYMFEFDTREERMENKWTYGHILEDVRFSLPEIERQLRQNDPGDVKKNDFNDKELTDRLRFRANSMYVASESLDHVDVSDMNAVNKWFKDNFDLFKNAMRTFKIDDGLVDCTAEYTLSNIISRSNDKELVKACLEIATDKDRGLFDNIEDLDDFLNEVSYQVYVENKKMIAVFLTEQAGLDHVTAEKLTEKWQKSKESMGIRKNGSRRTRESHLVNLDALKDLERARPGAAKELFEKFGIANFARYPMDALLKQLDKAEQDLPYGVVAFPEADHNGAFLQKARTLKKLTDDLEDGGQETRFIEVASQFELARRLAKMHQKYSGAGNKMDFLVIGGHGQPDSVQLGETRETPPPIKHPELTNEEYQQILETWNERQEQGQRMHKDMEIADLKDGGAQGVRRAAGKWFDEDTQIVFISCSTGAEGGFAQTVTNELGFATIAPNIPAYVKEIKVAFNERGKPVFDVDYGSVDDQKAEAMKYRPEGKKV